MNDRQILCFLETALELNFTRAADNLHLPQPAVSRYITALEQELGTTLFVRENNRNIYLSENGKTYFNLFQRFFTEFENVKDMVHPSTHQLRFGYNIGWDFSSFLPNIISNCKKICPDFQITIECLSFQDLAEAVLNNKLDAIVTLENYPGFFSNIVQEHITSVRRNIIYAKRLFPSGQANSPSDFYSYYFFIADEKFINPIITDLQASFAPYHFTPKFKTVSNMATLFSSVENGLGVAMLDEWGQNIHNPNIHHIDMDSSHQICLAWRRGATNSAIHIFKKALTDYFVINEN